MQKSENRKRFIMRGRYIVASMIYLCLLLTSGCISFAQSITPDDNPDPNIAYLYGRFQQTKESHTGAAGIVAIILEGTQARDKYIIRFQQDNSVQCIPVKPGCYQITEWKAIDRFGSETINNQILTEHVRNNNLCLEKDRAYYLGDFLVNYSYRWCVVAYILKYVMKPPANNFIGTTKKFHRTYPAFSNLRKTALWQGKFFKDEFDDDHVLINKGRIIFY